MKHDIVVSNVGIVLTTEDEVEAEKTYNRYVELSKAGTVGRAAHEDVTWLADGDVHREYTGNEFIVTVHYALRVRASDMDRAQQIVQDMDLPDNYVENTFEIPDIHPAHK